jgi:hypothetical protein
VRGCGGGRGWCTDDAVYVVTAYAAGNSGEYQLPICERRKAEAVALVLGGSSGWQSCAVGKVAARGGREDAGWFGETSIETVGGSGNAGR